MRPLIASVGLFTTVMHFALGCGLHPEHVSAHEHGHTHGGVHGHWSQLLTGHDHDHGEHDSQTESPGPLAPTSDAPGDGCDCLSTLTAKQFAPSAEAESVRCFDSPTSSLDDVRVRPDVAQRLTTASDHSGLRLHARCTRFLN